MEKRIKIILLGFLFLIPEGLVAQKYNIKTYSVNDGLPSSQVYDVHLDEEGLVWFATAYGLVKFDGNKFITYGKQHGLRDELIYDIFEDYSGRFWVSTEMGGVGYLASDSVYYPPELARLDSMLINYIVESPSHELWFGTNAHGVLIWNGNDFRLLTKEEGLPSNMVWDIHFTDTGEAWIATMEGVAVFKEDIGITKVWEKENGLSGTAAYQAFEASDGTMWIPTSSGITLIKNDSLSTITEINGQKLGYVYNISEDNDGLIWIGTERKGLYWYDGESYTHITRKNGLSSNFIYRLIKAEDGTIWVATDGDGISIFRDKKFKFYDNTTAVSANAIYSIFTDDEGTMWYGMEDGIGKYKNGKFTKYSIELDFLEEGEEIWDIEQLPNGNLLLLTYNYWLIEFDGEKFFRSDMIDPLREFYITDVLVTDEGDRWIAYEKGIIKYNEGEIEVLTPSSDYWASYVTLLYEDSKGNLWLGTEGGAAKYDGKEFTYFTEEDGMKGQSIYEIKEDTRGNIWIGTNKGISVIKNSGEVANTSAIHTFETEDVYLPETISLLFDSKDGLWQGTNGGLNYYNVEKWYTTGIMEKAHYALQDHGNGVEFNGNAVSIDENNDLWFGTARKGLLQYDVTNEPVITLQNPPLTFIRRVYANDNLVYDQNSEDMSTDVVQLEYDQNNLDIDFGAVNYKDPFRIYYRYKMDGFEDEWNTGFDTREAVYTNMEPGDYTFKVMSKSTTSEWGSMPTEISIHINKPYWMSVWFYIIIGIILVGLMGLYIRVHLNIVEKKKLKKLVDEQTHDLQSALEEKEVLIKEIHHRVKNNMAVVSGLLELQSWKMEDGEAKNAIEDSKLRIKAMSIVHEKLYENENLAKVHFKEFIHDLVNSISNSLKAGTQNIQVSLDIEVEELDVNTAIPCGLLLNELICNAYEHAFPGLPAGNIFVSFKEWEGGYKLVVSDDGIGIPENILEEERSSLGLTIIESLNNQIDGELLISSKKGSTITIIMPRE